MVEHMHRAEHIQHTALRAHARYNSCMRRPPSARSRVRLGHAHLQRPPRLHGSAWSRSTSKRTQPGSAREARALSHSTRSHSATHSGFTWNSAMITRRGAAMPGCPSALHAPRRRQDRQRGARPRDARPTLFVNPRGVEFRLNSRVVSPRSSARCPPSFTFYSHVRALLTGRACKERTLVISDYRPME